MTHTDAIDLAIDALEAFMQDSPRPYDALLGQQAIEACRAALAAPSESSVPVAIVGMSAPVLVGGVVDGRALPWASVEAAPTAMLLKPLPAGTMLYPTPQPAPQPLTDERILNIAKTIPPLETCEQEWLHFAHRLLFAAGILPAPTTGEGQ
jgi:hypothetical protein